MSDGWMTRAPRRMAALAAIGVMALTAGACSSSDDADSSADETTTTVAAGGDESTTTEAPAQTLTILVGNDDGVGAPGIAALVEALAALPDTEVIVSAPAEEQSGTGGKTTEGELEGVEATTARGYVAHSVEGFPADAINWALDGGIDVTPDLVVTGLNSGQNLGGIGDQVSGTIGAARAAVAHGVPALATSAAMGEGIDYDLAATFVVEWVEEHRQDLLDGKLTGDAIILENMNIPNCPAEQLRGVVEVPMSTATDGAITPSQDCASTLEAPADDIIAFNNGFVSLSSISFTPAAAG